jgi:hypothetical protein
LVWIGETPPLPFAGMAAGGRPGGRAGRSVENLGIVKKVSATPSRPSP